MIYRNSYLEKTRMLLEIIANRELSEKEIENLRILVRELTDESEIERLFRNDIENIFNDYEKGKISGSDAVKNLQLLKVYAVTQLEKHIEKVVMLLKEATEKYGIDFDLKLTELGADTVSKIVEYIENAELRI
jgi:predicted sugar kinase